MTGCLQSNWPLLVFQTRTVPFLAPVAKNSPSGEKAEALYNASESGVSGLANFSPDAAFDNTTRPESAQLAIVTPSGLILAATNLSLASSSFLISMPVRAS